MFWIYKSYENSALATILNFLGTFPLIFGIIALFFGDFGLGILCVGGGAAAKFCAKKISESKAKKNRER